MRVQFSHLFLSISLNLSNCTILVEILPKALKRATISFLVRVRSPMGLGRGGTRVSGAPSAPRLLSKSPEKRILRAVPRPVT